MGASLLDEVNKNAIIWDQSKMTTGFQEIDAQHKEWISRFNEFENTIKDQKGEEKWVDNLLFFIRYTETHIRCEEEFMDQYHCSARNLNKEEHKKFQKRIQEISYMTWPLGATAEDVQQLEAEMIDWLNNHICNVDVKLRDCVVGS
jgi:hemerythrin